MNFTPPKPFKGLIGHRGVAKRAPENTLSSFEQCKNDGFNWIEFDLRLSRDEELIIFHDDILQRTTNGEGSVHHHTLNQLLALDAGSWFHPQFANEKIPHFESILPKLLELDLFLNIELKTHPNATNLEINTLVIKLLKIIEDLWPKERALPLVSSFNWKPLIHIRKLNPEIPLGFLHEECSEELLKSIAHFHNAAFHCNYKNITDAFIPFIQHSNIPILAYTVNDPAIATKLLNAGIFGLFSDDPLSMSSKKI